ncbi:MAG: hypothetical protein HJJLKODD_02146 [Phycisphaerae bacterium]|nr:hypothetical protein [Phycisphaerae bacterium]
MVTLFWTIFLMLQGQPMAMPLRQSLKPVTQLPSTEAHATLPNSQHGETLFFPKDRVVGEIRLRPRYSTGNWQYWSCAAGEVSIPQEHEILIIWSASQGHDLSPLQNIQSPSLKALYLSDAQINDEQLQYVSHLTSLEVLHLDHNPITDAGLRYLSALHNLKLLHLASTHVQGFGFEYLRSLNHLSDLRLADAMINDEGIKALVNLTGVTRLFLLNNPISDNGLNPLKSMSQLRLLTLGHPTLSAQAITELQESLPATIIRALHHQALPEPAMMVTTSAWQHLLIMGSLLMLIGISNLLTKKKPVRRYPQREIKYIPAPNINPE